MEIVIGSKVKHIPTGKIVTVKSKTKVFIQGTIPDEEVDWMVGRSVKVRITECETYIEPPKEKSAYEIMRERNMEDAKKLTPSPKEVGQHILWLKMAVMDRIEQIENLKDDKLKTFRSGETFGFTEPYVNLLMHHAYEAGKNNATDSLTRHFNESTRDMKTAMDSIIKALDDNGFLPDHDNYEY
jgi:hypothetical protein